MVSTFQLYLILVALINCHAETYLNIGKTQGNLVCGINNDNCTIICNEEDSCHYVRFTVLNNHITIKCSAYFACYGSFVYASNVKSLTIIGDDEYSLSYMRVHVDANSQQSQTVINCTGDFACFMTQIQAINGKMDVNCDGLLSCYDSVVMMPTNISQVDHVFINVLNYASGSNEGNLGFPLHIVSLYPINMNNVMCINDCSFDSIWLYNGVLLTFCRASDQLCIQDMWNYNIDNLTVIDAYLDVVDFTDYDLDINDTISQDILIILWEEEDTEISFSNLNTFSIVSIICFRCKFVTFSLDAVQNVILTVFGFEFDLCMIYGPQEYFKFNCYGGYSRFSEFWLMNTKYIQINSPRTYAVDEVSIYTGSIYVGHSNDVSFMCRYDTNCQYMDLVTTADLINVLSFYNSLNIECNVKGSSCFNFFANFSEIGYICPILKNDPLQCVKELATNNDKYDDSYTNNRDINVIFTLSGLTQDQQEFFKNDYNEYSMNVTTSCSVNRTKLILKLGYLISYINENSLLIQTPELINLTFTDFVIYFDDVYDIQENRVKIKSNIVCKNKAILDEISAITNQKYTFINTTSNILRKDYNNNNLHINVSIPIASLGLEAWVLPLIFGLGGLLILVITFKLIKYIYRKYLEKYISHPLVLILGIGEYDNNPSSPDFIGQVQDIPVEIDVNNLIKLFKHLNYQIIGNNRLNSDIDYDNDIDNDIDNIQIHYTADEVIRILNYTGKTLSSSINEYDGLIVIISCHGIRNNIITSDYKLINKDEIHRLFSINYPNTRKIPRLFIFDCCDGDEQRSYSMNKTGKNVKLDDNNTDNNTEINENIWKEDGNDSVLSLNPDYKLVTIHGANLGFQSKMDLEDGSYLINEFRKTLQKSISNKKRFKKTKNLGEIFSNIQQYLHKKGKQQTINTFNNYTSYLILKKNTNKLENIEYKLTRKTSLSERVHYASEMAQNIVKLLKQNKNEKYIQNELIEVEPVTDLVNQKKNIILDKYIAYFNNNNGDR